MKQLFKVTLVLGFAFLLFSCKASKQSLSSHYPNNSPSLKARVFMLPIADTPSTNSKNHEVVNLQKVLAMYKLSFLKWPESKAELAEMIELDSLQLDLENFSTLSWASKGDSLLVTYLLRLTGSGVNVPTTQEGKFTLFVDQETIQVGKFSVRESRTKAPLSTDSIR